MSFDGIITRAIVKEFNRTILGGKIEKIYQPEPDELVLNIHSKNGNFKLYASSNSSHARTHFISDTPVNPASPLSFCMLMRKHLQGGRISEISQKEFERIIEFSIETYNELGFSVNKKLIVEIMGKHSNIILVDTESMKVIDSIKRVSIDVSRFRQLLPGKIYNYPPSQNKLQLNQVDSSILEEIIDSSESNISKALLDSLQGISPAIADTFVENATSKGYTYKNIFIGIFEEIKLLLENLENSDSKAYVFMDKSGKPLDYHIIPISAYMESSDQIFFETLSQAMEFYYSRKDSSNRIKQNGTDLEKAIKNTLNKLYLKKQRLSEDLLNAEDSESYRLFGELLTANIHLIKPGESQVKLTNYYDGTLISIGLDKKLSPSKNAQQYFKKYGKAKTAVKEKGLQLEEVSIDIEYMESVSEFLESAKTLEEIQEIRSELISSGYLRKRKTTVKNTKSKLNPYFYSSDDGFKIAAGRNNTDNDILTFKLAGPKDIWFHSKDMAGSHVILFTEGKQPSESAIFQAASIAALHSKGKNSENVPVDYTKVKYVKKPKGAKPGMVIFTDNKTVYVNPYTENSKEKV